MRFFANKSSNSHLVEKAAAGRVPTLRSMALEATKRTIALEVTKLRFLSWAYAKGLRSRFRVNSPEGRALLGRIYTLTSALSVEQGMPSFEETCRRELNLSSTEALAEKGAYGFENFAHAHRIRLQQASIEISYKLDRLKANLADESLKENVETFHRRFLSNNLDPAAVSEVSKILRKELLNIYRLLEEEFNGPEGILQNLIYFINGKHPAIDEKSKKDTLLFQMFIIGNLAQFLWVYSDKIRLHSKSTAVNSDISALFTQLNARVLLISKLIHSPMDLGALYKNRMADARAETQRYDEYHWEDFERCESSKKYVKGLIGNLQLLQSLLRQHSGEESEAVKLEIQKLKFILVLIDFKNGVPDLWASVLQYYAKPPENFQSDFVENLNKDIEIFGQVQHRFKPVLEKQREFTTQSFCSGLVEEVAKYLEEIQRKLTDTKNASFRLLVSGLELRLSEYQSRRALLKKPLLQVQLFWECACEAESLFERIEFFRQLYNSPSAYSFWVNKDVKYALVSLQDRASAETNSLRKLLMEEVLYLLQTSGDSQVLPYRGRGEELNDLSNIWKFLQELKVNAGISSTFASNLWWINEFVAALKRQDFLLDQKVNEDIQKIKTFDGLLRDFLSRKIVRKYCHSVVKIFSESIKFIESLVRLARAVDEQENITFDFFYWETRILALQKLKFHYESLEKFQPVRDGVDSSSLISSILNRNNAIHLARQKSDSMELEFRVLLGDENTPLDKSRAEKMLRDLQETLRNCEKCYVRLNIAEKDPVDFSELAPDLSNFLLGTYFPELEALKTIYVSSLKILEEKLEYYLECEEEDDVSLKTSFSAEIK